LAGWVKNRPIPPLTGRLWERLVLTAGVPPETRWAELSRRDLHRLAQQLIRCEIAVSGKSLNKDEFVTCGGVRLSEVEFKTMESRLVPGLYFAGELLDIDGSRVASTSRSPDHWLAGRPGHGRSGQVGQSPERWTALIRVRPSRRSRLKPESIPIVR
jgi:hypothetical protein